MRIFQFLKHFDWWLFIPIVILVSIGIVVIYSTTWGEDGASLDKVKLQIIVAALGLLLLLGLSLIDYRILKNYRFVFYIIMIVLLVTVLLWGTTIRGSKSWFSFASVQFQPSEIAKIIFIISFASVLADFKARLNKFRVWLFSGILVAIPAGLIVSEHDLGTAAIFILIWLGMLLSADLKLRYFLIIFLSLIIIGLLFWFFILAPYQKARVLSFLDPEKDPLGEGYSIIQSMIAVGSGGIFGKGLGYGSQSQLKFLPEQHTDFIFAVIAEEFGFLGGFIVLLLFVLLILRILQIARLSLDRFGIFLCSGMAILILVQVMVNVGMNIGLLPVAGISLPLISYGGSGLLSFLIGLGIVESVYANYRKASLRREK